MYYIHSIKNITADAMSRLPLKDKPNYTQESDYTAETIS